MHRSRVSLADPGLARPAPLRSRPAELRLSSVDTQAMLPLRAPRFTLRRVLMRALALLFNAFPVRWQRRFMTAAHERFLVGVTGLGIDRDGRVLLARHRFGAPEWRFLGGFLAPRERVEDALTREVAEETGLRIEVGPVLEVVTGYKWQRVELVFAYRVIGGAPVLTDEVAELRGFDPTALPDVRADQRGLIERHAATAFAWARSRP